MFAGTAKETAQSASASFMARVGSTMNSSQFGAERRVRLGAAHDDAVGGLVRRCGGTCRGRVARAVPSSDRPSRRSARRRATRSSAAQRWWNACARSRPTPSRVGEQPEERVGADVLHREDRARTAAIRSRSGASGAGDRRGCGGSRRACGARSPVASSTVTARSRCASSCVISKSMHALSIATRRSGSVDDVVDALAAVPERAAVAQ